MSFEGTDCPLSGVVAVDVWRDKLELAVPLALYSHRVCLDSLVIKDLYFNSVDAILETCHDAVVCRDAVSVVPGLERFDQNGIGVNVVRQQNAVFAAAGADGEVAHVICVELAGGINDDVELLGFYGRKLTGGVGERLHVGRFGLGGARTLSGPSHVSFEILDQYTTVFCRVCISEAWSGSKVASFHGR